MSDMAVVGGKRAERLDRFLYLEEVEWSSAKGRVGDSAFLPEWSGEAGC